MRFAPSSSSRHLARWPLAGGTASLPLLSLVVSCCFLLNMLLAGAPYRLPSAPGLIRWWRLRGQRHDQNRPAFDNRPRRQCVRRNRAGRSPASAAETGGPAIAAEEPTPARTPAEARRRIRRAYERETSRAGGVWHSLVTVADPDRTHRPAVEDKPDEVVPAASVNKLGIACAVLDKIDRGELRLDQKVELTPEIILCGDGIYHLQTVWGDQITLANVLTAMLMVSDNTAVRLCGLVCTGLEINDYLARKGFAHTRVEPLPTNPHRMFLGNTTARETHTLLSRLVGGSMVSPTATRFMLEIMRRTDGFHDGVRRTMSSDERLRTAIKYGALDNGRHEVGIMFSADGSPELIFSFFADLPGHGDNYGATNPLVEARARLGRRMFDQVSALNATVPQRVTPARTPGYRPNNGG
jgi:beta-lactamase class A